MSHWCSKCKRTPYVGCDSSCPAFGYDEMEADQRLAAGPKPMLAQLFARSTGIENEYIICGLVRCAGLTTESVHVIMSSAVDVIDTRDIAEQSTGKGFDDIMQESIWRHFK